MGVHSKPARIRPSRKLFDDAMSLMHWTKRDLALENEEGVREYLQRNHLEYPTSEWMMLMRHYHRIIELKYSTEIPLHQRFIEYNDGEVNDFKREIVRNLNIRI